jgi:hypothetical protein
MEVRQVTMGTARVWGLSPTQATKLEATSVSSYTKAVEAF